MENQKTKRVQIVADALVKIVSLLSKIRCKLTCCKSSCNNPPPNEQCSPQPTIKRETML